jgi:protein-tyrosine phosphatase
MIDLHSHILPGLDDGPDGIDGALDLARAAADDGIRTIATTPHIRDDFPLRIESLADRRRELQAQLGAAAIPIELAAGGELAVPKLYELDDHAIAAVALGGGPYVLVESPYNPATELLEGGLFELRARGFRPILAHPERSPSLLSNPDRLAELVASGVLCSVTAASLAGGFGKSIRRYSLSMFRDGLVHNVASDSHDTRRRGPQLSRGLEALARDAGATEEQLRWLVVQVPEAILAGTEPPPRPGARTRSWRARILRGRSP